MTFLLLPSEIWREIIFTFDPSDFGRSLLVCKTFYECMTEKDRNDYREKHLVWVQKDKERYMALLNGDDEKRHGLYCSFFSHGCLQESGWYHNGKKIGMWKTWEFSPKKRGTLSSRKEYVAGAADGNYISWHSGRSGILEKGEYVQDLREGKWKTYSYHSEAKGKKDKGAMISVKKYHQGLQEGREKKWNPATFFLEHDGRYCRGRREGLWYCFFDDEDNILQVKRYVNGVLNGECITYFKKKESKEVTLLPGGYSHGDIFMRGTYCNNEKTGVWRKWYQHVPFSRKRTLREYEVYKKDKLHGPYWYWNRNGELGREGRFKNGNRVGVWTFWDEKGNKTTRNYEERNPITL